MSDLTRRLVRRLAVGPPVGGWSAGWRLVRRLAVGGWSISQDVKKPARKRVG